jgi:hypothetical protein
MTQAECLAEFVVGCSYDQLSSLSREQLRMRVLDAVACAVGALGAEPIRVLREHTREFGGPGPRLSLAADVQRPIAPLFTMARRSVTSTSTTAIWPLGKPAIPATILLPCLRHPNMPAAPAGIFWSRWRSLIRFNAG